MHAKHGLCIALAAAVGFAAGLAIASRPPQCPAHRPTPWPTHGQLWQVLSIQTEFRQAGLTVEGSLAPDATPKIPAWSRFSSEPSAGLGKARRNRTA